VGGLCGRAGACGRDVRPGGGMWEGCAAALGHAGGMCGHAGACMRDVRPRRGMREGCAAARGHAGGMCCCGRAVRPPEGCAVVQCSCFSQDKEELSDISDLSESEDEVAAILLTDLPTKLTQSRQKYRQLRKRRGITLGHWWRAWLH
jgi:hypothetical protein